MEARCLTPILNVSDLNVSFEWFSHWGWKKNWEWGEPADFGCIGSGECEIFLCLNGQGGKGKGENKTTFHEARGDAQDKGVWISVWVDDVDEVYEMAKASGIEVVCLPEDMPWGVRECHLRHPDGHVFRVSTSLEREG